MGHDRGPDDPDRHGRHAGLSEPRRDERAADLAKVGDGPRQDEQLDGETDADGDHEQEHHRLDQSHPEPLQTKEQQHVRRGDQHAPEDRDAEEQVQGDRAPQHLRKVAGGDSDLAEQPVGIAGPARQPGAAGLGEVPPRHDPEPGGDDLKDHGHQAGQRHHPHQVVAELGAPLQVRRPVARVHVADADQQRGPGEGAILSPGARSRRRGPHRAAREPERRAATVGSELNIHAAGPGGPISLKRRPRPGCPSYRARPRNSPSRQSGLERVRPPGSGFAGPRVNSV